MVLKLQLMMLKTVENTYEQRNIRRYYPKILIDAQFRHELKNLFVLIRDCEIIVKLDIHFFHVFPEMCQNVKQ